MPIAYQLVNTNPVCYISQPKKKKKIPLRHFLYFILCSTKLVEYKVKYKKVR